ncbi:MAG: outer membrane beta-barrel protein [Planctomycetota bacterium]|jgi:hypothetical protein
MNPLALAATLLLTTTVARADVASDVEDVLVHYRVYADAGYLHSSTDPENGIWRSKTTTFRLDRPEFNLGMAMLWKPASAESRWGFEIGVQAGVDTELAVPDVDAIGGADVLQYFYRASLTYLFPVGNGLSLTGGILPGPPGYESYLSIDNPTYTRGYITDFVPYFVIGVEAAYSFSAAVDASFFVVTGWNYLSDVNDVPSLVGKVVWRCNEQFTFTQTLYWGPDQADTAVEFWRFFSDSILEYRNGPLTLAAVFDVGTEKDAVEAGAPRNHWISAALWARWDIDEHWSIGVRPELIEDPDGVASGSKQRLGDISVALRYRAQPARNHALVVSLEYRYDRSSGPEGGFFSGPENTLVGEQHLIMVALNWSFAGGFGAR